VITKLRGRIGIFYPWGNLETLPCLRDAAMLLVNSGYTVEFYTLHEDDFPLPDFRQERITVITDHPGVFTQAGVKLPRWTFGRGGRPYSWFITKCCRPLWRQFFFERELCRRHAALPYKCFIGMDPEGLIDAAPLAKRLGIPFIFWSLELRFAEDSLTKRQRTLKTQEIQISRQADIVIIQDKWRAKAIIEENGFNPAKIMLVPNSPIGKARRAPGNYIREQLGIPPNRKIVLCAGTIRWWAMSQEIVEAANSWPENYILVMHSRQRSYTYGSEYVKKIVEMADPQHVIVTFHPTSSEEYRSLVDSADIGLALYNPFLPMSSAKPDRNLEFMGFSSGKLAAYLHCGLPVIVNQSTGPKELINEYHCGICVTQLSEISNALGTILKHYDEYSANACRCFNERLEFSQYFIKVIKWLEE